MSYIAKRIKGRGSRELRKAFPHLKEWCNKSLWAPSGFHGSVGHGWDVVERYIQNQEKPNAKTICTGIGFKSGVSDFGRLAWCMPEVGMVVWVEILGGGSDLRSLCQLAKFTFGTEE